MALIRRGLATLTRCRSRRNGSIRRVVLAPPGVPAELTDGPYPATYTSTY